MSTTFLIYADFEFITVITSETIDGYLLAFTESPKRYSRLEFKTNLDKILNLGEQSLKPRLDFYTNLLTASPLYEQLETICRKTWISDRQTYQQRFLEQNKSLSKFDNYEQGYMLLDLIASELVSWGDVKTEARVKGYLKVFKKDEVIADGLLPYLYFLKYCADDYFSMWNF